MNADQILAALPECPPDVADAIRALDARAHHPSNQVVLTDGQVCLRLIKAVQAAGSQSQLARDVGISRQYLFDVLNGGRQPGPALLKHLKLKRLGGGNPLYTVVD
jgi:DNA-binding phage protein